MSYMATRARKTGKATGRFAPGARVMFRDGREATVERFVSAHNGHRIRFDERRQFEPETIVTATWNITPADMDERIEWEARWPAFTRRERKWTGV